MTNEEAFRRAARGQMTSREAAEELLKQDRLQRTIVRSLIIRAILLAAVIVALAFIAGR